MISCWQTINAKELRPVKMDVRKDVKMVAREIVKMATKSNNPREDMPQQRHILTFKIFLMKIYRLKVCFSLIALWVAFDGYSQKSELDPYVDFLRRQNTSAVD